AIEVEYAKLAPEAKQMFDWAHILHRQLYDVLADERLDQAAKDREVARLVAYYRTRPDLAFSARPKSMRLMQEQPYSLAFRKRYPKFNGLIWGYHWMQVGLYEPLVVGGSAEERQAGVRATVARFWQMLEDPPRTLPYQMPMTPAVAPRFAARYPAAAIIFDNLHSMHDVVSDILANPDVPRARKRAEILLAARRFRDDTSYVMPVEAWRTMAQHMGVENMGGPAVGFLQPLPTPTVTYGAVMQHDDRTGEMTGFAYGHATGGAHGGHAMGPAGGASDSAAAGAHAGHTMQAPDSSGAAGDTRHAAHGGAAGEASAGMPHDSVQGRHMQQMMELHERMLADPVIRDRMRADTAMRRMMGDMMHDTTLRASPEHREHMRATTEAPSTPTRRPTPARRSTPQRPTGRDPHAGHGGPARPAAKAPTKPAAKGAEDPHAGHGAPPTPAARDTSAHHGHHP
ncbi:MAG: hypothetical protein ACJ79S_20500, partial [Gemmatimonadaceae bacterium]